MGCKVLLSSEPLHNQSLQRQIHYARHCPEFRATFKALVTSDKRSSLLWEAYIYVHAITSTIRHRRERERASHDKKERKEIQILTSISSMEIRQASPRPTAKGAGTVPLRIPRS